MQAICHSLKAGTTRKRALDLSSLCLGLAVISIFKWGGTRSTLESSLLVAASSLYSFTCPLLTTTYQTSHFSQAGLLCEKGAHLCLFLFSQGWAVFTLLALKRLEIGDATALSQVATVLTPIVSYYALDSKLDPRQILLLPVSFVGVILLCRPVDIFRPRAEYSDSTPTNLDCMEGLYGVFWALGASACRSFMGTALKATRRTSILVSTFTVSGASVLVWTSAFLVSVRGSPYSTCREGVTLFVCGILASGCVLVRGTPWSETNRLQATLGVVELALAYALQVCVFGVVPDWSEATGSALISACALGSAICGKIGTNTSGVGSQFSVGTTTARKSSTGTQEVTSSESSEQQQRGIQSHSLYSAMGVKKHLPV